MLYDDVNMSVNVHITIHMTATVTGHSHRPKTKIPYKPHVTQGPCPCLVCSGIKRNTLPIDRDLTYRDLHVNAESRSVASLDLRVFSKMHFPPPP